MTDSGGYEKNRLRSKGSHGSALVLERFYCEDASVAREPRGARAEQDLRRGVGEPGCGGGVWGLLGYSGIGRCG